jgi:peptidoglycan/LPS O-acetylase OafA/YrhL
MVIQRWQSVFLLVGAIVMAIFPFWPMATVATDTQTLSVIPTDYPVYTVLNLLTAVLMLVAIFLFKNLKRQLTATLVAMVLVIASAVCYGILLYGPAAIQGTVAPNYCSVGMLIVAFVMTVLARRGIRRDRHTLSSYDRLR